MAKKLEEMTPRELAIHEIFAHLDGIEEICEQMTSGNLCTIRMLVSFLQ